MTYKIKTPDEVLHCLGERGQRRVRLVLTNGCFDLLHVGHVRHLKAARNLGGSLAVGLNSDASVRALKGPPRPIFGQDERAELLAALACVDFVVLFEENTAERLVSLLRPDIYVKGSDYAPGAGNDLPEAAIVRAYGGQVTLIPIVQDLSTTAIIQRIAKERRAAA